MLYKWKDITRFYLLLNIIFNVKKIQVHFHSNFWGMVLFLLHILQVTYVRSFINLYLILLGKIWLFSITGQTRHYVNILDEVGSWIFGKPIILKPTKENNTNSLPDKPDNHVVKADYNCILCSPSFTNITHHYTNMLFVCKLL